MEQLQVESERRAKEYDKLKATMQKLEKENYALREQNAEMEEEYVRSARELADLRKLENDFKCRTWLQGAEGKSTVIASSKQDNNDDVGDGDSMSSVPDESPREDNDDTDKKNDSSQQQEQQEQQQLQLQLQQQQEQVKTYERRIDELVEEVQRAEATAQARVDALSAEVASSRRHAQAKAAAVVVESSSSSERRAVSARRDRPLFAYGQRVLKLH